MEAERKARDEQFLQTWKVHNESAAAKNSAIISAAAAMEQVSLALLKKLQTTNSQVKILIYIVLYTNNSNSVGESGVMWDSFFSSRISPNITAQFYFFLHFYIFPT